MDSIKQANHCRSTLVKMFKFYSKYEGKNLNRYKNLKGIEDLAATINATPFEINGLFSGVLVDHQNVNTKPIKDKIESLENIIFSLDNVETDLPELISLTDAIKDLSSKKRAIISKYKDLPSYFIEDLIRSYNV